MNSLTSTPHAPKPGARHGRSRAFRRYHAMSGAAISGMRISLGAAESQSAAPRARLDAAPRRMLEAMRLPITPATTLLRELRDEVRQHYRSGRVIIAVDGIDGAGKTVFADALAEVFAEDGSAVFRASIDDFHRPRVERYARGRRSPEGFYRDSFDYSTFRRVLIDPFREGGQTGASTGFQLAAFDLERDTAVEAAWTTAPRDAVLIVDGVFLHRPELRGLWNWSVWLDVPVDVAFQRMALRDGTDPSPSAPSNARYRDGQELYLKEAEPRTEAYVIVDNTDLAHPHRVFADYC